MTALNTFGFSGYTLRPAATSDLSLAQDWTEADDDHRETTFPTFWLAQGEGCDSYLLSDPIGPVFFFKMVRVDGATQAVELHIQFMPEAQPRDRERKREGLTQGMEWLERILRASGISHIRFKSTKPELIAFCRKRLGFRVEGEVLSKDI